MDVEKGKNFSDFLYNILLSHYNNNAFSGASLAFHSFSNKALKNCLITCGVDSEETKKRVDDGTFFDLASLTKPLVTLLSLLSLLDQGKIGWRESLGSLLGRTVPKQLDTINLSMLMSHCSGLPAHRNYADRLWLVSDQQKKEWLIDQIFQEKPGQEENRTHIYSDLGYILLGYIVEYKAGMQLDSFWYKTIAEPLGLRDTLFFPVPLDQHHVDFAVTGRCRFQSHPLAGIVHDENCRAMGGIAGHAGLFGTARGVLRLCREMLALYLGKQQQLPLTRKTFRRACTKVGSSDWTAGFQLPSHRGSSSGNYFSANSFGHLGFTGTSFWIDPERELIVVLLTNRVCKGDDLSGVKKLRPEIHDRIVEQLVAFG